VDGFRNLARRHPGRIRLVDGSGSTDEVFARVWAVVEEVVR
jgi:thymidylate kinase